MAIIRDLKRIYDLINNLIMLRHSITMDIRYWYHVELGKVKGHETLSREKWNKNVHISRIMRRYTIMEFIKVMLLEKNNRKNLILTLSLESDRTAKNYQGSRPKPNVTKIWQ